MSDTSTAFVNYWRVLGRGITTTIVGLTVTLKYLFSRPITVEYPDQLPKIPDGWRGEHAFETDRCIVCRQCERICPVECITLESEGKGKKAKLLRYEIDYGKCLHCNLCCEVCPTVCLWMSEDWDLACYTRDGCVIRYDTRDPEEEREKLWPSLAKHPARLKDKAKREKADAKANAAEDAKPAAKTHEANAPAAEKPEAAESEPKAPESETPKAASATSEDAET